MESKAISMAPGAVNAIHSPEQLMKRIEQQSVEIRKLNLIIEQGKNDVVMNRDLNAQLHMANEQLESDKRIITELRAKIAANDVMEGAKSPGLSDHAKAVQAEIIKKQNSANAVRVGTPKEAD